MWGSYGENVCESTRSGGLDWNKEGEESLNLSASSPSFLGDEAERYSRERARILDFTLKCDEKSLGIWDRRVIWAHLSFRRIPLGAEWRTVEGWEVEEADNLLSVEMGGRRAQWPIRW